MAVVAQLPMSVTEFLSWEARQPGRYEFDGVDPVEIEEATVEHSTVQANLLNALESQLRGTSCWSGGGDLKVIVAGRVRTPDVLVTCAPRSPDTTVVENPAVVVEIFSDGTQHCDLITKHKDYLAADSIKHYVILEPRHTGAMIFTREQDYWTFDAAHGLDAVLRLPAIGIDVSFADIYRDVQLAPDQEGEAEEV